MVDRQTTDNFKAAISEANIPTLLMVLVQLTGDLRWLEQPYLPSRTKGLGDNDTGDLPVDIQAEVRTAALDAILQWRDGKPVAIERPSLDLLVKMLSVSMGEEVPSEYGPLIEQELGFADNAALSSGATLPPQDFRVMIVGAGISGICAAVKLQHAGIPFVIIERNDAVGGVWHENTYPGASVDTPSHLYSFSFAKNDWNTFFSGQAEIQAYLERVVDTFQLRPYIRLNAEFITGQYDAERQRWQAEVRKADGLVEIIEGNALITGVGIFNPPVIPPLKGLDSFKGPAFHSARWRKDVDLKGKRVAVIGNGATSMQIVPAIVDEVESVAVFQRSPQWAVPAERYREKVPASLRLLLREVPLYQLWYRIRLFWNFNDKAWPALQNDPNWQHPERSISPLNDSFREYFTQYIRSQLGDRVDDLFDKVLPHYPPWGKRMLLDNGWFKTLQRDDVELVTESIREIRPEGIVTSDGKEHKADVLVLATGFDVIRFLSTLELKGRSGQTLRQAWEDDNAKAYLGLTVPDFPNMFTLYGPNLQTAHGGSIVAFIEQQMDYVVNMLKQMFARGVGVVEVRNDVYEDFNRRVDELHSGMVWSHQGMTTYYRNSRGRVVVNNPWRVVDFWHMTHRPDLNQYVCEPARTLA